MSKNLISALLHALCDVISIDIRNKHNIYERKMQEHFFGGEKHRYLDVGVYGGHIEHRLK